MLWLSGMGTLLEDLSTQARGWSGPYQTANTSAVGTTGKGWPHPSAISRDTGGKSVPYWGSASVPYWESTESCAASPQEEATKEEACITHQCGCYPAEQRLICEATAVSRAATKGLSGLYSGKRWHTTQGCQVPCDEACVGVFAVDGPLVDQGGQQGTQGAEPAPAVVCHGRPLGTLGKV